MKTGKGREEKEQETEVVLGGQEVRGGCGSVPWDCLPILEVLMFDVMAG